MPPLTFSRFGVLFLQNSVPSKSKVPALSKGFESPVRMAEESAIRAVPVTVESISGMRFPMRDVQCE